MLKWIFCFVLLLSAQHMLAQVDAATIRKIAIEISNEYVPVSEQGFMNPEPIFDANLKAITNTGSLFWKTIRKLELSGVYKNEVEILEKIIPAVNREFLSQYYLSTLNKEQLLLYSRVSGVICDCIKANNFGEKVSSQQIVECWKASKDSGLIKEYQKFAGERWSTEQNTAFVTELLSYTYIHCDTMFKSLINPVLYEVEFAYYYFKADHKNEMLLNAARLYSNLKKDSLILLFPGYTGFVKPLSELAALYRKSGSQLEFSYEFVFKGNNFERYSAMITDPSKQKAYIIGQAVFEIGTDKEKYYLKKLTFYPRENMQGIDWLEKNMEESRKAYKAQLEKINNNDF